jgi:deazaflavin-dependent oxidoreductase (nitroreductase family)
VTWLLRSPLHRLVGGGLLLLTVTGRRSGRRYTIPVGYQRDGDVLHVLVSKARRKQWWRNFREPAPVEVELRGERWQATGRLIDAESAAFRDVVAATLQRLPMLGRQLGIAYDPARGLSDEQRRVVMAEAALVEIRLTARRDALSVV